MRHRGEVPNLLGPRALGHDEEYTPRSASDLLAETREQGIRVEPVLDYHVVRAPWHPPQFITPYDRTIAWLRSLYSFERSGGVWTLMVGPIVVSIGDTPFRRARRHARLMALRPPQGLGIEETVAWHRHRMALGEQRLEPSNRYGYHAR